jgi:hypothetical protein
LLDSFPVALRLARGWIVGGGLPHGAAYGSGLVVDERAPADSVSPAALQSGRRLWVAVTGPVGIPANVLDEALRLPVWRWDVEPSLLLRQLEVASDLDSAAGTRKVDWAWVMGDGGRGPVGAHLKHSVSERLVKRSVPLSAEETSALLDLYETRSLPIDGASAGLLDADALLEWLARRGIPPAAFPAGLSVPASIRRSAWETYLDRIDGGWPSALEQALQDLARELDEREVAALVRKAVVNSLAMRGGGLGIWLPLCKDPRWGSVVRAELRERVSVHARHRGLDWVRHYLLLGDDPGGERLLRDPQGAALGDEMVRGLLAQGDEEALAEAETWLRRLAVSPLRRELPTELKLRVAERVGKEWTTLRTLHSLAMGADVPEAERAPAGQREALLAELSDLLRQRTEQSPPPAVAGIHDFFDGKVPTDVQEQLVDAPSAVPGGEREQSYLREVEERFGPRLRKRARQGLRQGREERRGDVVGALAASAVAKDPGKVREILGPMADDERLDVLAEILHGTLDAGEAESRRQLALQAWVRAAREDAALGELLGRALRDERISDAGCKRLARRHLAGSGLLDEMLAVIPREAAQSVVRIYADGYTQDFVQEAIRRLKRFRGRFGGLGRPGPTELAMALYLRDHAASVEGKKVRQALMRGEDVTDFELFMGRIHERGRKD